MVALSAHANLTLAWIGYLNAFNLTGLASIMSDNFSNKEMPASMGMGTVGKQEYLTRLAGVPIQYFNLSVPAHEDIFENTNKIMFYCTADGKTKHGFPYQNEYIMVFTFEGDKILTANEFVDPSIMSAYVNETIVSTALKQMNISTS